jgi:hypothetical protein
MFNALTTIYATIYDTETPLLADWHTSEISDLFGGDAALLGKLLELKTEIFAFCKRGTPLQHRKLTSV